MIWFLITRNKILNIPFYNIIKFDNYEYCKKENWNCSIRRRL